VIKRNSATITAIRIRSPYRGTRRDSPLLPPRSWDPSANQLSNVHEWLSTCDRLLDHIGRCCRQLRELTLPRVWHTQYMSRVVKYCNGRANLVLHVIYQPDGKDKAYDNTAWINEKTGDTMRSNPLPLSFTPTAVTNAGEVKSFDIPPFRVEIQSGAYTGPAPPFLGHGTFDALVLSLTATAPVAEVDEEFGSQWVLQSSTTLHDHSIK
jgi:hypothetical protein